jgi:uncharacterized protein
VASLRQRHSARRAALSADRPNSCLELFDRDGFPLERVMGALLRTCTTPLSRRLEQMAHQKVQGDFRRQDITRTRKALSARSRWLECRLRRPVSASLKVSLASPFRGRPEKRDAKRPAQVANGNDETAAPAEAGCQSCGACCAYSREWPRFSLEDDAALALIPPAYVDNDDARMRCVGDRCAALTGEIGVATSCAVYDVRPDVCRACEPGDDACVMARRWFGI